MKTSHISHHAVLRDGWPYTKRIVTEQRNFLHGIVLNWLVVSNIFSIVYMGCHPSH